MKTRLLVVLLSVLFTGTAYAQPGAQVGSSCLRPLGIPDKWVETQTPPWDPTDTYDPSAGDYYDGRGFDPAVDHGTFMTLSEYHTGAVTGRSMLAVETGGRGSDAFRAAIVGCSGWPYAVGSFLSATGMLEGVSSAALDDLISQDPTAWWDPSADGGRGGVADSSPAFAQSPRIIALPVFAPDAFAKVRGDQAVLVRIVGFFVTGHQNGRVSGHLTATSRLTATPVTARIDEFAQLSAQFAGPGSPIYGLPLEFLIDDVVVGSATTDGTGTARPSTTTFNVGMRKPGEYPGVIRVRLAQSAAFFAADEAAADLTVLRKLPFINWPHPAAITYGTPLGPEQLNATTEVEGAFIYTPGAGTVLAVDEHQGAPITARFVPTNPELYEEATETVFLNVLPAPLVLTIHDINKLYLDPMPALTFSAAGFVNGDTASVLTGTNTLHAEATSSSLPATYRIIFDWVAAENYSITLKLGALTVLSRPTITGLQAPAPGASTYGQSVAVTATVSSSGIQPVGTVTLQDFDRVVAVESVSNGQVTFNVTSLNAGGHSLSAVFDGGPGFTDSFSASRSHTVARASTTTQLTASLAQSRAGQAVTFTAAVAPVAPGAGIVSGNVEFLRGGVVIASVPVSNGTASLTTTSFPVGKHSVQARYVGTINHAGSSSAVLQHTVKNGGK